MNVRKRHSLMSWHGVLEATSSKEAQVAGIVALTIVCVSMVATQLNYVVVGDAHMIVVLAPITLCALLHGPLAALFCGAVAGLTELIHATWLPLDYYEKYFMAPWNSIGLFALVGLVVGLLFALIDRQWPSRSWQRALGLTVCCVFGSTLFTVLFSQSAYLINTILAYEVPVDLLNQLIGSHEVFSQWIADIGLMVPLTLVCDEASRHIDVASNRTIRQTFQGWLAVVIAVAYMISGAFAYTAVSVICRGVAEEELAGQLNYLAVQIEAHDSVIDALVDRNGTNVGMLNGIRARFLSEVTHNYSSGVNGVSVVAEDGVVVSSSVSSYLGRSFESVAGAGFADGFDPAVYDETRSREWDMGDGTLGYARISQMGYARVVATNNYQLLVALPATEVYRFRGPLMIIITVAFLAVFAAVFVQASLLLQNVVVRGFDRTNDALGRITKGDLDEVVDVHDTEEFTNLSGIINSMVSALKDSIAEAEQRLDAELITAKAIQQSALPQTFPPFPQVDRFDIYASMKPAREVGGDFYDFFLIDEHTLGFLVADVSGKGIPASLFMMAAKTELANYMLSGMDLTQAIQSVNYHLCQGNEAGMFVTVWAAILDYETGRLTYVNAGHNPPLLRHNGRWEWLRRRGGLFLGTFDTARYRSDTIRLAEGDELVIYTDGVTEAFSVGEEEYGEARLEKFLAAHVNDHPRMLVEGLRGDVAHWADGAEQSDDITVLSLEYGVAPQVTGSITVPATLDNLEHATGFLNAELTRRLCPIEVQHQIDIALEELFVNICNYAYDDEGEPGQVRVDYIYNATPNAITVQLTDHGDPFDPFVRADPEFHTSIQDVKVGGLGIYMTKESVDDFVYLRDGDSNIVVFKKTW